MASQAVPSMHNVLTLSEILGARCSHTNTDPCRTIFTVAGKPRLLAACGIHWHSRLGCGSRILHPGPPTLPCSRQIFIFSCGRFAGAPHSPVLELIINKEMGDALQLRARLALVRTAGLLHTGCETSPPLSVIKLLHTIVLRPASLVCSDASILFHSRKPTRLLLIICNGFASVVAHLHWLTSD